MNLNPDGAGNNFDIADKITVSDFRQKQIEKHQGEEIEAKPEVKIKKPKPASLEEEQKKLLSQIIDEVNALYDKDYEPDFTTKAAMQIRDILLKNAALKERLEKSAKNNTLNEFKFTYDDCVQDALVEGYDQNVDFYTLLLNNEEIRAKFANVFMREIYRILREGTQTRLILVRRLSMAKASNPFMHYVADYEKEAEAFLTKYECADAIDQSQTYTYLGYCYKAYVTGNHRHRVFVI